MKYLVGLLSVWAVSVWAQSIGIPTSADLVEYKDAQGHIVIAPRECSTSVARVHALMNIYAPANVRDFKFKPVHDPIIFSHYSTEGNGFVDPMSQTSFWFGSPLAIGNQEWLQSLAVHEGRHMAQLEDQFNRRWLYYVLGDVSQIFYNILLPNWYFEGDATWMETANTLSGRGRSEFFLLPWKSMTLDQTLPNYWQAHLGGEKLNLFYADPYTLGYLMVSDMRMRYGDSIMSKAVYKSLKNPFNFTFNAGLKKTTGQSILQNYENALEGWSARWNAQSQNLDRVSFQKATLKHSRYWDAYIPVGSDQDSLYVVYYGKGEEVELQKRALDGTYLSSYEIPNSIIGGLIFGGSPLQVKNNKLTYLKNIPDLRWAPASKSSLEIVDLKTQEEHSFSLDGKTEVFAVQEENPNTLNPGVKALTVAWDESHKQYIKLWNLKDETLEKAWEWNATQNIVNIQWLNQNQDGKQKALILSNSSSGNRVQTLDLTTGEVEDIILPTFLESIQYLQIKDSLLYFASDYTGSLAIHQLNLNTPSHTRKIVAQDRIGLSHPVATQNGVAFAVWTGKGLDFGFKSVNDSLALDLAQAKVYRLGPWGKEDSVSASLLARSLSRRVQAYDSISVSHPDSILNLQSLDYNAFSSLRFLGWGISQAQTPELIQNPYLQANAFNVHGAWADPAGRLSLDAVASVWAENQLKPTGTLAITYSRLWPELASAVQWGARNATLEVDSTNAYYSKIKNNYSGKVDWNILKWKNRIELPLNLSPGNSWIVQTSAAGLAELERIDGVDYNIPKNWSVAQSEKPYNLDPVRAGQTIRTGAEWSWLSGQMGTSIDLYPYLSQSILANIYQNQGVRNGKNLILNSMFTFPGFGLQQHIVFKGNWASASGKKNFLEEFQTSTPLGLEELPGRARAGISAAYVGGVLPIGKSGPWILERVIYLKRMFLEARGSQEFLWRDNELLPFAQNLAPSDARWGATGLVHSQFNLFSMNLFLADVQLGSTYNEGKYYFAFDLGLNANF